MRIHEGFIGHNVLDRCEGNFEARIVEGAASTVQNEIGTNNEAAT